MAGPRLRGRAEVLRKEQRLKSTFKLVDGAGLEAELSANYARYLCILVAGFAEQALKDLVTEYARCQSSPAIHKYTELNVNKMWGINQNKLKEMLDSFDSAWYEALDESMQQELSSLHSVGKLRDNISHGSEGGITLITISQYADDVFRLIRKLCDILEPDSAALPRGTT